MKERIHLIPVGGDEPLHTCSVEHCFCHPLLDDEGVVTHNALDLREARERHGRNRPGENWVLVKEIVS